MAKTPISPVSHPAAPGAPRWVARECLAGIVTALALVPEVISFSVIAGVDPKVSLLSSIVLCLVTSLLGGRRAMVTAAAGSVALVIGPMVHVHGVAYILPTVLLAGVVQILFGVAGLARMMRYIPRSVMVGFVNAPGILIFFAQVPHLLHHDRHVWLLFALAVVIVLGWPRLTSVLAVFAVGDCRCDRHCGLWRLVGTHGWRRRANDGRTTGPHRMACSL